METNNRRNEPFDATNNPAMLNERFAINRAVIERRFPPTAAALENAGDRIGFVEAKNGLIVGSCAGIDLHSRYDPVKEGALLGKDVRSGDRVVLYGIGLGYHLPPLLEAVGDSGFLLVIEANAALLKGALSLLNPDLVADERFRLVAAGEESALLPLIAHAFAALEGEEPKVIIHPPSLQAIPRGYDRLKTAIEMLRMERRFPVVMGGNVQENIHRNADALFSAGGVGQLTGIMQGGLALLIGAGATLDRDIALVSEVAHRAMIISSDTAYPALLRNGVEPDLVITVDSQPRSLLHFALADRYDLPLLVTPSSNADLIAQWKGPLYFGLRPLLDAPDEEKAWLTKTGVMQGGGSVSCFALELALLMGAETVALFGQDFSVYKGNSYASETAPGYLAIDFTLQEDAATEENYFGAPISAPLSLYSYRRTIEDMVAKSATRVVTFSANGPILAGVDAIATLPDSPPAHHPLPLPSPVPASDAMRRSLLRLLSA